MVATVYLLDGLLVDGIALALAARRDAVANCAKFYVLIGTYLDEKPLPLERNEGSPHWHWHWHWLRAAALSYVPFSTLKKPGCVVNYFCIE